ncbi:mitochondrial ubiquitin ligase activator of NFKB 1 [Dorcoceras hygrometricum]|uniref:RING-type E3 ubiquitin transferase n=1 Tax=Dorcoceras hygrometricum TaxID=472368 RepID=A0A2Z7CNN7_9LAMI|nr:mitochondrial ubiquitin ligase activator of NFKB 1 [Dorcoceras hygrometricum]
MSARDRAVATVLLQLSLTADGAFLGVGLAYVAFRCIRKFFVTSSAIRKIHQLPYSHISDLRSLCSDDKIPVNSSQNCESQSNSQDGGNIVIVRGIVEAQSAVNGQWTNLRGYGNDVIVSHESGEKGVILEQTQTYIYNEWSGILGWTTDLRSLFPTWKEKGSSSIRMVPFVLVEAGKQSAYVHVNMEGSRHPLPLITVYRHVHPINAFPSTFLQALFGNKYPVGLLDEEKILPLGKDVTVVGICSFRDGIPEIKSCKDLPYFLSEMTKEQMISDLSFESKVLMWGGLIFGTLGIAVLTYSVARNWVKWKAWRQQREARRQRDDTDNSSQVVATEEESADVPDGELCVICLTRRRRSAFIPCGHLVCCQRCALSVEREVSPKCPVCRQSIRSSVRIYDS